MSPGEEAAVNSLQKKRARCDELIEMLEEASIKHTFGMELSYDRDFNAVFAMPHHPGLRHAQLDTHGGVIATLIDNAGWFTAAVAYDFWIATVELQVRILEPANQEDLRATGRLVRAGRRIAVTEMEVHTFAGRLIAIGSGTFAVTSLPTELSHQDKRVKA